MMKTLETSVKIKFKVPSLSGKPGPSPSPLSEQPIVESSLHSSSSSHSSSLLDENNIDLNLDIMEAPAVAAGTELKRRRRQKKKKKKPMTNDEDMPIDFDQGDNSESTVEPADRGHYLAAIDGLTESDLSSVKQNPVVKKEKGPIKIQDMPTFISDLRGFVNSMKEIKLKGWHAKATVLPTIGSSIELPVWTK